MTELTYRMESGYRLPNLLPPDEPEVILGKYALMRRRYLQQHRRVTYTNLLTTGKLTEHLMATEAEALCRLEAITSQMAKAEGVTEALKASDQMTWVQRMNSIRQRAEEMIMTELVYS